jgi:hypothetical protein
MTSPLVRFVSPVALVAVASALGACTVQAEDDEGTEFREAVPLKSSVSLDGPESSAGATVGMEAGTRGVLAAGVGAPEPASWYTFTRNVRDGVNVVTGVVLVSVWAIVHTRPSELDEDQAVWGPYDGDALDPVRFRLTVTRIGEHHFRYVLDGQAKAAGSDSAFLTVLDGDGYSRKSELHGDGTFRLNLDNARALDPARHAGDSGSVTITHDLPADIGRRRNALPRFVGASIDPGTGEWLEIQSRANEDGTGSLALQGLLDLDDSHATLREEISVESRWRATGAGRADIELSGGDLPEDADPVTAVECWGADFGRVYYADSVDFAPSAGSEAECAYGAQ